MSAAFQRWLKLFSYFAGSAFVLGAIGYLAVRPAMPHGDVFGALYRMFLYHEKHPFQYIAIVAITYGMIATPCAVRWSHFAGRRRVALIGGIIAVTIVVASVPGGVLWKIHDMQAGFFTTGERFWFDLFWGATTGLQIGWLIIALSLPYNLFGLIAGYAVTDYGLKIGARAG